MPETRSVRAVQDSLIPLLLVPPITPFISFILHSSQWSASPTGEEYGFNSSQIYQYICLALTTGKPLSQHSLCFQDKKPQQKTHRSSSSQVKPSSDATTWWPPGGTPKLGSRERKLLGIGGRRAGQTKQEVPVTSSFIVFMPTLFRHQPVSSFIP